MSALPLSSPRPARAIPPRRHLEVAPTRAQRRARPRVLPAVVTVGGIIAILLTQLLLSIVLADGAYQIADLQSQTRELERQQEALTEELEVLSSTQNLTANAESLGMVASGNPVFLDLATGKLSGSPTKAGGRLTGSGGNQIGNALLTGTPLVEKAPASTDPTQDPASATPSASSTASTSSGSTSSGSTTGSTTGTIPSPTTR